MARKADLCIGLIGDLKLGLIAYRGLLEGRCGTTVADACNLDPVAVRRLLEAKLDGVVLVAERCDQRVCDAVSLVRNHRPGLGVVIIGAACETGAEAAWDDVPHQARVSHGDSLDALRGAVATLQPADTTPGRNGVSQTGDAGKLESDNGVVAAARARLSQRETELLTHLAEGRTLKAAAERMRISYKTADSYRSNLMRKLGIHDRVSLTRWAIRADLVAV